MTLVRAIPSGLLALALACPVIGQQYGQWSWAGDVQAGQRTWESRSGETTYRDQAETTLRLNLGLRGFVIDPLIAEFRLSVDSTVSDISSGLTDDLLGYDGQLHLIPQSSWPIQIYARRQVQELTVDHGAGLFESGGFTNSSTSWGGRLRARSGVLSGMALSVDRSSMNRDGGEREFVDRYDRELISWARNSRRFQHHIDVRHVVRELGLLGFEYEDYTASLMERAQLSDRTRLVTTASAYRRDSQFDGRSSGTTTYRARSSLTHALSDDEMVGFTYQVGGVKSRTTEMMSHRLAASWDKPVTRRLTIRPFVAYGYRGGTDFDLRVPEVGLASVWTGNFGSTDVSMTAGASWIESTGTSGDEQTESSELGYSTALSIYNGGLGFRKGLEVAWARNEFDTVGDPNPDLPDLGAAITTGGLVDILRVRASAGQRWGRYSVDGWIDWIERSSEAPGESGGGYDITTSTASLQFGLPRGATSVYYTSSEIASVRPQTVESTSAVLTLRLWSSLSLTSSWMDTVTEFTLGPDIDRQRLEGGLRFGMGLFALEVKGFETREESSGIESVDQGTTASIRRSFGGWLPIVSAPERRGVIR